MRLNQALRVLAETSETPEEVRLELSARTALAQQKLAKQVQEGIAQLVDEDLVQFGVVPGDVELHLLADLTGHLAHLSREALEQVGDGDHPEAHRAGLVADHSRAG